MWYNVSKCINTIKLILEKYGGKNMNSFSEVFEEVKKYCVEVGNIGNVPMKTWIGSLQPVELNGTNAVFKVQTEFQKKIIEQSYGGRYRPECVRCRWFRRSCPDASCLCL